MYVILDPKRNRAKNRRIAFFGKFRQARRKRPAAPRKGSLPRETCINGLLIISGFIGSVDRGFRMPFAPFQNKCLFYANDARCRSLAIARGWKFMHMPEIPISTNHIFNSMKSKKMKFLQMPFGEGNDQNVLWIDHKRHISAHMVKRFFSTLPPTAGILIRATPSNKSSVWQEFHGANNQHRYRIFAPQTRKYIVHETAKHKINANGLVANTGLILYNLKNEKTKKLANAVYKCILQTGNPMCQIFWMIESQKYPGLVKIVPYRHFNV